jgi:AMMECR1 domain-containing protein
MRRFAMIIILSAILLDAAPVYSGSAEQWKDADSSTKAFALSLARRAFDSYVLHREVIPVPDHLPVLLRERAPVFVSTMRNFAPRCCMGSIYPIEANTAAEIISNAVAAAGRDRRFAPVKPSELKQLTLIVSILDPPRAITADNARRLDPVSTGLIAQCGDSSGVVLSGETRSVQRMLAWARIRAGAKSGSDVRYFEIHDTRLVEQFPVSKTAAPDSD